MSDTIPWKRTGVEGVVIVASILLAFGIEAWWGERKEGLRTEAALASLETGLVQTLVLLESADSMIAVFQSRLLTFTEMEPSEGAAVSPESAGVLLGAVVRPIVLDLNGEEVLKLFGNQDLGDLADPAYQAAVAGWRALWQTLRQRHESIYEIERATVLALGRDASTRSVAAMAYREAVRDVGHRELRPIDQEALPAALQNAEVMALASAKLSHWDVLRALHQRLRARTEEVIGHIQDLSAD